MNSILSGISKRNLNGENLFFYLKQKFIKIYDIIFTKLFFEKFI